MKCGHIIGHPCLVVFCFFIAFYNYQLQADDVGNTTACEESDKCQGSQTKRILHRKIRLPIRAKNGGLIQISLCFHNTVLELQEEVDRRVDIPPEDQIISHGGSGLRYMWENDTLLGDIGDLEIISRMSHLLILDKKDLVTDSFDEPLQNFLNLFPGIETLPKVLRKMNITQLRDIGFYTEQEFVTAGLRLMAARKLLQRYPNYIKKYLLERYPNNLDIEPFDEALKHFFNEHPHCLEMIIVLNELKITEIHQIGLFSEEYLVQVAPSLRAAQKLWKCYCDTRRQTKGYFIYK